MSCVIDDKRVWQVWEWCSEAYLRHGIRISFPNNTDPHKTYQWRFVLAIANKFEQWEFDEHSCRQFLSIAAQQAKHKGLLRKGLAALHQSNLLDLCYRILTNQHKTNQQTLLELQRQKTWLDTRIADRKHLEVLTSRQNVKSLSNLTIWYKSQQISELFISLSKSCTKAVNELQHSIDSDFLPAPSGLYIKRLRFMSETNIKHTCSQIFGKDLANT